MSPRPTNVSSRKAHRALKRLGFVDARCSGSHQSMVRERADGGKDIVVLVLGKQEINPFTLRSLLQQGGVDLDEFNAHL